MLLLDHSPVPRADNDNNVAGTSDAGTRDARAAGTGARVPGPADTGTKDGS
jgi:hypothetical protein